MCHLYGSLFWLKFGLPGNNIVIIKIWIAGILVSKFNMQQMNETPSMDACDHLEGWLNCNTSAKSHVSKLYMCVWHCFELKWKL